MQKRVLENTNADFIAKSSKNGTNSKNTNSKTLRLIYPQWQGGDIATFVPELEAKDVSLGYALGAELLEFLAPKSAKTARMPVSMEYKRESKNGILNYDEIFAQTKAALELLEKQNPDKILTLGGECSVSVPPFSYLGHKYKGDVAVVWIDAHKDLNLPGDSYEGYHAMALASCCGLVDKEGIAKILPYHFSPKDCILVGVRDFEGKKRKARRNWRELLKPREF